MKTEGTERAVEPQIVLPRGNLVTFKGRDWIVERRLPNGRWQFLDATNGEPDFLSDRDICDLLKAADFYVVHQKGLKIIAPPPISPMAIGEKARETNARKHDYVISVLSEGYSRSRDQVLPRIQDCAARRGETPPGFTTVLTWMDQWERHGQAIGTAAYSDRHDLKGERKSKLETFQEEAIAVGIELWLGGTTKKVAYATVETRVAEIDAECRLQIDKSQLGPPARTADGRLKAPSLRTFERRCAAEDRMLQDWSRVGPAYAKQKNRTWQTLKLPDRPFEQVEVDHCTLDILIVDDRAGLVLGRPDLIVFRDRATGMIVGRGLGFEAPSYASFVRGLEHVMYPKNLDHVPGVKTPWPCYGRIENLFVDNALHFIGDNIRSAGKELDFNVVRLHPRQPWLKGALERFFGTLNTGLIHDLPGTTLSNVLARKDHEHLGLPNISLSHFEAMVDAWICEVHHLTISKGLGVVRGLGEPPLQAWNRKAKGFQAPPPPHRDLFLSLAGDCKVGTIQNDGIVWDYIKYESPELWILLRHPKHKRAGEQGGPTRYRLVRDPHDLGAIYVIDPHDAQAKPIRVSATEAHREYAAGLTKHNHDVIRANVRAERDKIDFSDLVATKAALAKIAAAMRNSPARAKVERAVGRYLDREITRRIRTEVRTSESPPADYLAATPHPPSQGALAPAASEPRTWSHEEENDDLDKIRRGKVYNSYVEQ